MAKFSTEGDRTTIEFERLLPHSPASIWSALTESEKLKAWYLSKVRIEPGKDGKVEFWIGRASTAKRKYYIVL